MKINAFTVSPRHQRRSVKSGFTLIELMVVIALVALLASLSMVGIRAQMKRSKERETSARIEMFKGLLESYKTDHGEFPEPTAWDSRGEDEIGQSWQIGGGACLYQALTGDGTNSIQGFQAKAGESPGPSKGEFGSSGTPVYMKDSSVKKETLYIKSGDSYVMADSFRHPIQYRRYDKKMDKEFENEGTYDMWSYGASETGDDSEAAKKLWIKNW